MSELARRYAEVRRRIPGGVTLIAVSKTKSADEIAELVGLGQMDFGENYAQEMIEKAEILRARGIEGIRWHFIGPLQRNKVKSVLPLISCLHTVDSWKLVEEIQKRNTPGRRLPVFVQVNIDEEASKSGLAPDEVPEFLKRLSQADGLEALGLMCIPDPARGDPETAFRKMTEMVQRAGNLTRGRLSMGMTDDFEVAIRCGATHVRVGSAIFGSRNPVR